jgi:DNA invertase Pin-like site-specific DNA recombinase
MPARTAPTEPVAYSYVRFSTPDQMKGDSLRRQLDDTAAWCERNGVRLDTSLTLRDLGVSAFRGAHRDDKHDLSQFLRAVNQGRVAKGSYLVIENLDRLTREDERTALRLWLDILDAGVNIVQLTPETVFRHERSDMTDIIRAIIELSRGHSESRMKSKRNGDKWEEKRKAARAGGSQPPRRKDGRVTRSMTDKLPAWVEDVDGTLRLIPARAAAVHRAYVLAGDGLGAGLIVKALIREKHRPLGPSGEWSRAYVSLILGDRRAVGEHQPRYRNGRPAGDPIPGYYPPAVSEAEWQRARLSTGERKQPRGRVGKHVNVFAGLLHNAREGDRYYVGTRTNNGKHRRVLMAQRACENGSKVYGFDFDVFERAVLGLLREAEPREILGDAPGQDEVIVLSNELRHVKTQQEAVGLELLKGDVAVLAKAARALDAREKELKDQLNAAQQRAAHPAGEQWGEAMSLIDVLDTAPDPQDARLKLRALLGRRVDEIWLLVVPRSETRRLCAVEVFFAGGARRDYLILQQSAGNRRPGGWWARALADVADPGDLDLRRRDDAAALEKVLLAEDLERLQRRLAGEEPPSTTELG